MNNKLMKIQELHEEIYKLTQEVNQEAEDIGRSGLDPEDVELAELLHENLCHANHTDGCDWYYNKWTNPGYDRQRYLEKAWRLREAGLNYNIVERFFECI